jgi:hypothetical protein
MTKRRHFSDTFKAAVTFEVLRGDKTVHEIAAKRQLHLLPAAQYPSGQWGSRRLRR